jgi:peptide/nickel transport system substrate-binding protein
MTHHTTNPASPADAPRAAGRTRLTARTAKIAATAIALPAIALTVAACGNSGTDTASAAGGSDGGKPVSGGTINYGHEQEVPSLTGGWVQQAYISRQFLDSLVSEDKGGKIVPWLAQKWEVSKDATTWTFHLKPGVKFTDGTPLDAQAVSDNFEYWLNPKTINSTVNAYIGEYYESSKAIDATTLEVKLKKPYAPLLAALSQGYFGIQSPTALKKGVAYNAEHPVGSGPFIVQKWNRGQNVVLVKNPNYNSPPANAKHTGPAYVDKIVWKFLHDPTSRYGSLTTGQSDVIYDVPTVDWEAAKAKYEVQQYITPGRPVTASLNTTKAPFNDVKVRQAFAYASDRKAAVESAFNHVIPSNGNGALSQSTPGYDKSLADTFPHDVAKANALLDQAGYTQKDAKGIREKDGKPLHVKFVYPAGAVFTSEGITLLQTIQAQAKEVGFDVQLVPATQAEALGGTYGTPDSYDAISWYWTSPTAAVLDIVWKQNLKDRPNGFNSAFYNDPALEKTIKTAISTLDETKANELYAQAQKKIVDNALAVGLYTQSTSLAISPKLKDVWLEQSQGEPVFYDAHFVK